MVFVQLVSRFLSVEGGFEFLDHLSLPCQTLFTVLLGSFNPPVSSIFSMQSSPRLGLPCKGKQSIFPLTTTIFALVFLVWFSILTVHSPLIGRSWLSDFNLIVVG